MSKKYKDIQKGVGKTNKEQKRKGKTKIYISRTKLGFCKNEGCNNKRRDKSAYCGQCK